MSHGRPAELVWAFLISEGSFHVSILNRMSKAESQWISSCTLTRTSDPEIIGPQQVQTVQSIDWQSATPSPAASSTSSLRSCQQTAHHAHCSLALPPGDFQEEGVGAAGGGPGGLCLPENDSIIPPFPRRSMPGTCWEEFGLNGYNSFVLLARDAWVAQSRGPLLGPSDRVETHGTHKLTNSLLAQAFTYFFH